MRGRTILVVDDDVRLARLAERTLVADGHEVVVAGSADEALDLAAAGGFDLVLSDLRMPDGDGLTLLRRLASSHPGTRRALWSSSVPRDVAAAAAADGVAVLPRKLFGAELLAFVSGTASPSSPGAAALRPAGRAGTRSPAPARS